MPLSLACRNSGICRHPWLQLLVRIRNIYLDAIHKFYPLLSGLHVLGCKLGLRRNERQAACVCFPGIGVRRDLDRLADLDPAQIGFIDVGAQPNLIEGAKSGPVKGLDDRVRRGGGREPAGEDVACHVLTDRGDRRGAGRREEATGPGP